MKKSAIILTVLVIFVFVVGYFVRPPLWLYIARLTQSKVARIGWASDEGAIRLNAPFYRQEHSLSCEVAALRMALAGVGIYVSESELISRLEFDPTPKGVGVWGDPYKGFVGDINGQMLKTGYGVYWDPIARLGLHYTRTEVIADGSLQHLTAHLDQGRPVVIWGHFGVGNRYSWQTPAGKTITAINGEHARTLVGYIGSSDNPHTLILLDPIYGEQRWTVVDFMNNWQAVERGAVAVYSSPRWAKTADNPTIWEISTDGKIKYGIAMTWEEFVAQGGFAQAIIPVSNEWLGQLADGGNLSVLPSK